MRFFLTPLRFDAGAALVRAVSKERQDIPIISAINGEERLFTEDGVHDYRGENIIAVSKFVDALDWGLVVKQDTTEALLPVRESAKTAIVVTSLSIVLVITLTLLVTRSIVDPISSLTLFAENLQKENFSMRTEVRTHDEIGFLAQTMNTMAKKLHDVYQNLEQQVEDRTRELGKFQLAVDSSTDGVIITSKEPAILYVNQSWTEITGYSEKEVLGKNPNILKSGKTKPEVYQRMWEMLKENKSFETTEIVNRRKDGRGV